MKGDGGYALLLVLAEREDAAHLAWNQVNAEMDICYLCF